ncbi:DNA-binding LacI/PurR family transcriptional regulator [Deinobacterium chartae]|uniref:DNA-binding LacI/PurR family transcriptional regulator n=1 Tax=Deinobacterium chartae TaxID=521158 RepID=A0A841I233_9DEIO|nr:LacI family DNA-binding transcriptional regulator [Deinobacterium chartae]MBB6098112.1 DNA-binding LacI/PurR family transcriptional regulator [Deinobacterium chartae]
MVLKRPTQKEVAQRAGVSQAVVSQVLNDRPSVIRVTRETRERVLAAMRDLGYVPNAAAQRLAGGRNRLLGVFTYEPVFPTSTRDFYYPFLEGIEEAAAALDHDLLLHTRPAGPDGERRIYHNGGNRLRLADGTLLLGFLDDARREELGRLLDEGHPVVFIGRRDLPGHPLPFVGADYAGATAQAARALLAQGPRRVLYVGAPHQHESSVDRERGYLEVIRAHGLEERVIRPEDLGGETVRELLAQGWRSLLLENDRLARRWIDLAHALGCEAPRDYTFAVLGDPLDGPELPQEWAYFHIPRREMGRRAVAMLVDLLSGKQPESVVLPCTWRPGPSIGQAAERSG